jgi:hypothetical protein
MRRDGIEDEARFLREAIRDLDRPHPTAEIPRELRSWIMTFVLRAKTYGWGEGNATASLTKTKRGTASSYGHVAVKISSNVRPG